MQQPRPQGPRQPRQIAGIPSSSPPAQPVISTALISTRSLHETDAACDIVSPTRPFPESTPMERANPPFRAEHVGSLIRPAALVEAREKADGGEMSDAELKRIQHEAIRDIVRLQEDLGLKLVTDG